MNSISNEDIERRMTVGRGLARPFEGQQGVIGAFVHGSSVRPYADDTSDIDIAVVVDDDALSAVAVGGAHQKLWEGGRKVADLSFFKQSVFKARLGDIERFRATHARVLFDRQGVLTMLLAEIAALPAAVAADRMRVHYFEVTNLAAKILAAERRTRREAARVLTAQLVLSAARLLFLSKNAWPSPVSWMFDELELAGVPAPLIAALRAVLEAPAPKTIRTLRGTLDEYLLGCGAAFVGDPVALLEWVYETPDGLRAAAQWGFALG